MRNKSATTHSPGGDGEGKMSLQLRWLFVEPRRHLRPPGSRIRAVEEMSRARHIVDTDDVDDVVTGGLIRGRPKLPGLLDARPSSLELGPVIFGNGTALTEVDCGNY